MLKKLLLGVSSLVCIVLFAQDAAYPDKGELSLQAGAYQVRIAAQRAYTISGFEYQSFPLLAKGGANGSILTLSDRSMMIGGSNTSEQICKLILRVDGTEQPISTTLFSGNDIVLEKESLIGGFRFFTTLNLTAEGLTCKVRFNYEKEQELNYFYIFVLGWHTDMTDFLYSGKDEPVAGTLKSDGNWLFNAKIPWFALYQKQSGFGTVTAISNNIPLVQRRISLWDHKFYKKNYIFHKIPDFQKEKESAEYVFCIGAFQASEETWQATAKAAASSLQSKLPEAETAANVAK
ncbi:MAG: hypothetical protein GX946_00185 [Oligosphaeraceae bacterium]|nr:hypothetical protein [Oligosphaeraceae bacterium]